MVLNTGTGTVTMSNCGSVYGNNWMLLNITGTGI
jgi:hypothetical protein